MKNFQKSDALKRLPDQFFAALATRVREKQQSGANVINLGQGNPDQPTPPHIVQALQNAASNPLYHKYPPFKGFDFLKEAVATFYEREYDVTLDPHHEVAVLFGGKTGLVEMSQCLLNPGDTALVPDPGYPDYLSGLALAGANMHTMPLHAENRFLPDYTAIPGDVREQAKMMFLNYPNNPTGAMADTHFFEQTIQFADQHDICVIHDFAYGAIGNEAETPRSFMQTTGAKEVGIEIYTLSKTYNMAGWRVAFAVGHPQIIEYIELLQDHYYVSLFGGIQEAAATALLDSQACVRELSNMYNKRRTVLVNGLRGAGFELPDPQGSFFVWVPIPEPYTSSVAFSNDLLDHAHVAVAPGAGFGSYGEGYIRIGLLSDLELIEQAIERIVQFNRSLTTT
ncbi:pyridoxal phosphate-dependent aminotransferase [Bacillaceae bacterium SIJ1]|uniref:pyridoxal phosphate-dependent aminotransferase n=1 Tax=Litoribacterium kuwaitense TaxID=1398745 RepID=UPI0013ED39D3|nr:pyridoxal phosphate-dependent aminotransferase [Litoribacterium kuwaitense]NGP46051.1 pyridoxal phosphate-dependent aminotransferase [Litoribacterium kuwaitense]